MSVWWCCDLIFLMCEVFQLACGWLSLLSQMFSYGENNGGSSWLWLKHIIVIAKWRISKGCFSTNNIFCLYQFFLGHVVREIHCWTDTTSPPSVSRLIRKYGNLDVSQLCGPLRPVAGISLPFYTYTPLCIWILSLKQPSTVRRLSS
jgi:hypothetical protein